MKKIVLFTLVAMGIYSQTLASARLTEAQKLAKLSPEKRQEVLTELDAIRTKENAENAALCALHNWQSVDSTEIPVNGCGLVYSKLLDGTHGKYLIQYLSLNPEHVKNPARAVRVKFMG